MIVAGALTFLLVVLILRGGASSSETFDAAFLVKPIGPGEQLTEEHLVYKEVPKAGTTEDVFVTEEAAMEIMNAEPPYTARTVVAEGEALSESMFSEPATEDGKRSMSFPVEVDHSNAGLVTAGDRIDIIATANIRVNPTQQQQQGQNSGEQIKNVFSWYVLTDVEVLSTSLAGEADEEGRTGALSSARTAQTVRVAVDDREALMVAAALELSPVFDVVLANGSAPVVDQSPLRLTDILVDQGF